MMTLSLQNECLYLNVFILSTQKGSNPTGERSEAMASWMLQLFSFQNHEYILAESAQLFSVGIMRSKGLNLRTIYYEL